MKRFIPILLLASMGTMLACKSTKNTTTSTSATSNELIRTEPQVLSSINRTACYGQCPMYKATFMDNGEVEYIGRRFVDNIGTYKTVITAEEVEEIIKQIEVADYFGLDSLYPTPIADFPSCITEAQLNGKRKKVVNRRNPPVELKNFEKFLDSMLHARDWEKVSDNTDYFNTSK